MENMKKQQKLELKPVKAKSDPPEKFFSSDKGFNHGIKAQFFDFK
jgi:hypothetical protein